MSNDIIALDQEVVHVMKPGQTQPICFEPINMCDFRIDFGTQQFNVHKLPLVQHSQYFKQYFERKDDNHLIVPDTAPIYQCPVTIFQSFLSFFYTNPSDQLLVDRCHDVPLHQQLYQLAFYFEVQQLMTLCETRIAQTLAAERNMSKRAALLWELWSFAEHWHMDRLYQYCLETVGSATSFKYYRSSNKYSENVKLLSSATLQRWLQLLAQNGDSKLVASDFREGLYFDYYWQAGNAPAEWKEAKCLKAPTGNSGASKYKLKLAIIQPRFELDLNIVDSAQHLARHHTYTAIPFNIKTNNSVTSSLHVKQ